jgi:ATP-dependent Clp protease ATP-binding subunit ClpB
MTSNLASHDPADDGRRRGPGRDQDRGDGGGEANFRPEFVNRIDEIVVFHPLARTRSRNIAKIQLRGLEQRLAKLDIRLDVDDAALRTSPQAGFDPSTARGR